MKVILIKDVSGVGRAGDIKEVSDGYARNFLIGKGLALAATASQINKVQKEKQEHQDKLDRQEAKLAQLFSQVNGKEIKISRKTNGANLFASVREPDIIQEISAKFGVDLLPKQVIIINPIKTVGKHTVELKLTDRHKAKITVEVEAA